MELLYVLHGQEGGITHVSEHLFLLPRLWLCYQWIKGKMLSLSGPVLKGWKLSLYWRQEGKLLCIYALYCNSSSCYFLLHFSLYISLKLQILKVHSLLPCVPYSCTHLSFTLFSAFSVSNVSYRKAAPFMCNLSVNLWWSFCYTTSRELGCFKYAISYRRLIAKHTYFLSDMCLWLYYLCNWHIVPIFFLGPLYLVLGYTESCWSRVQVSVYLIGTFSFLWKKVMSGIIYIFKDINHKFLSKSIWRTEQASRFQQLCLLVIFVLFDYFLNHLHISWMSQVALSGHLHILFLCNLDSW